MREYHGKSAAIYKQTKGKRFLLIPAIKRTILKTSSGSLLDVACGSGDFFNLVQNKGYKYYGLDISKDMIGRAQKENPRGEYLVAPAESFAKQYTQKFDVILMSMLLPAISSRENMIKILKQASLVLKEKGALVLGVTHPSFDHYMQSFLFNRTDVKTKFKGYYKSGSKFKIPQEIEGKAFVFEDYHWTLQDYFECLYKAGFRVNSVDECPPSKEALKDKEYFTRRSKFPTYLVLNCSFKD